MQPETDEHTAGRPGIGIFHPIDQIHKIGQGMKCFGGLNIEPSYSRVRLRQHDLTILGVHAWV